MIESILYLLCSIALVVIAFITWDPIWAIAAGAFAIAVRQ